MTQDEQDERIRRQVEESFSEWKAAGASPARASTPRSPSPSEYGYTTEIRLTGDGWVPAGGSFVLPRSFRAVIGEASDFPGFDVELDVEIDDLGRPRCRRLCLRALGGEWIDGTALRRVRPGELLRVAARAATEKVERDDEGRLRQAPMTVSDLDAFFKRYAAGPRPRRGQQLTDEHLRSVAEVYRTGIATGKPNREIADRFHVTPKTAARWVALARKRGHLGPAVGTRPGERKEKSR